MPPILGFAQTVGAGPKGRGVAQWQIFHRTAVYFLTILHYNNWTFADAIWLWSVQACWSFDAVFRLHKPNFVTPFQIAPSGGGIQGPPSNTWFLGRTRVHIPNGMSTGSVVLLGSRLCPTDTHRYTYTHAHTHRPSVASPEFTSRGQAVTPKVWGSRRWGDGMWWHTPSRNFFRFSPINGAIWFNFSTFWKPSSWCHCFFSHRGHVWKRSHESHDRVWCRLGGGSCPYLPPMTTRLQTTPPLQHYAASLHSAHAMTPVYYDNYNRHTHTRLTALCPGLPRWAGTRKVNQSGF